MNRFWMLLMILLVAGCFGASTPTPNPPDDGETDLADGEGESVEPPDSMEPVGEVSSDGSSSESNGQPAASSEAEEVRRLRELATAQHDKLAAASDYFETSFEDRGVSVFLEHLNHADAEVRRGAIYGLFTHFDSGDETTLSAIQAALDDGDPVVRRVALKTMALREFPREIFLESIPRIAKHLDDQYEPDAATRAHVARMLKRYSTLSQPALPKLDEALRNDPDFLVRSACLAALYDIAQTAEEALPAPTYLLLNDPDPRLRRRAAMQLGKYKSGAAPAVDELIQALRDDGVPQRAADDPLAGTDEPVCLAAADALTRIGQPAVQALSAATESEERNVRLLAIRSLGNMGPPAKGAVERLRALTQSSDEAEANAARAALVRITSP